MVNVSNRWRGKTAIITGASSGIGTAIVKKLSQCGINVVGLARRKELIDELAGKLKSQPGKVFAAKVDITKEDEILEAFKWVKKHVGPVHILVNNAGVVQPTTLINGDSKMWKTVFDTNVLGLCIATREAVKDMMAQKIDGQIININSIFGHWVFNFPGLNVYPASKFAVTALTQTLRYELIEAKTKIKVTSISPGVVDTSMINIHEKKLKDRSHTIVLKPEDVADKRDQQIRIQLIETKEQNKNKDSDGKDMIKIDKRVGMNLFARERINLNPTALYRVTIKRKKAPNVAYVLGTPPHVQIQELIIRPICEK